MFDLIFGAIGTLLSFIGEIIAQVIEGIFNFTKHVVGWFRGLSLRRGRDVPFIADGNSEQFREMLQHAPEMNVGIFEGVFDEETGEIADYQYFEADEVDERTQKAFDENGPLVVLK